MDRFVVLGADLSLGSTSLRQRSTDGGSWKGQWRSVAVIAGDALGLPVLAAKAYGDALTQLNHSLCDWNSFVHWDVYLRERSKIHLLDPTVDAR